MEKLLETARQDTELLTRNDARGDHFAKPRSSKPDALAAFIEDCRYGVARVEEQGGEFRVLVVIDMPTTQNLLCAVSGLMACLADIFGVDYDGWGCVLQRADRGT